VLVAKKYFFLFSFLIIPITICACASAPLVQPQVNSLVVSQRFSHALRVLEQHQESYGKNNELLYLLDYGLVLHLAGDYAKSIDKFEAAKRLYDDLYVRSIRNEFKTWLINDYYAPYRGEDFERVMISVFQALNYLMLGDIDEALVDARDVDDVLTRINRQYPADAKNRYAEDAFARFLMGILYEHRGTMESLNDAYISYAKAVDTYEHSYGPDYDVDMPQILKENMLTTAEFMGKDELEQYRSRFKNVHYVNLKEKENLAEVYLFYYYGLSPIKHQIAIPIPLPDGFFTRLAFPHYDERPTDAVPVEFMAVNAETGRETVETTQEGENITAVAEQNLANRRARVLTKAILRTGGKYMLERNLEERIEREYGDTTADVFQYVASLYNISSEQADLRSWQTLPAQIRVARMLLKPGRYSFYIDGRLLETVDLTAGGKKYFITRTTR